MTDFAASLLDTRAIKAKSSTLTLNNARISDIALVGSAAVPMNGVGITLDSTQTTINGGRFERLVVTSGAGNGAAIYSTSSKYSSIAYWLNITGGAVFKDNHASQGMGGAIFTQNVNMSV